MPTATAGAATPATRGQATGFALRLIAWSVALFGLFRVPWIGAHLLLPATQLQAAGGVVLFGPSSLPIEATLACSGADALALCLAAILAYPARWRLRADGIALGATGLLALNTIRIGTLGRAVASPRWFPILHVYLWPAVLTLAIAGFVFAWMRAADRRSEQVHGVPMPEARRRLDPLLFDLRPIVTVRFALTAIACLVLFALASPLYLESAGVLAVAELVARAAAAMLRGVGVAASAAGGVLATPRGAFLVTQECISTPLIPVYAAAGIVYARTWRRALLWTAAAAPLFFAIGVARLLVVALPASIAGSPTFFIHAFSQLMVAMAMVCAAAIWRYGVGPAAAVRVLAGLALAVAFVEILGTPYTHAILGFKAAAFEDSQGALLFLPAFQAGLFLALWIAAFVASGWRRFLSGAALLAAIQIAVNGGVQLVFLHAGIAPLVRDIRAWALVGPALIIATVVNLAPSRR